MNRRTSSQKKLLALQKRIFQALQDEADRLLGEPSPAIQRYERESRNDFKPLARALRPTNKARILQAIRAGDVTLVADFHTFQQAQRTALRLMRDSVQPGEENRWFIGLELIPSRFQAELDAFQEGSLDLENFHRIIRYEEEWGFPWKNYAPIFEWAREHGVKLIALNRPKELIGPSASLRRTLDDTELYERDRWAAGIITDLFAEERKNGKKPKMIVLYGELHIAQKHLPARIRELSKSYLGKALNVVCIHQNNDEVYWKLAKLAREHQTDALQLRKDCFHVVSSTPWSKLQSLVTWAEGGSVASPRHGPGAGAAETDEVDDEAISELETDYLSLMQLYGSSVAEFLGIEAPTYESLSVLTIHEADFVEALAKTDQFNAREIRVIQYHVANNSRIFIPRVDIAYLGTPSQNWAAELAAIHLHRMRARSLSVFEPEIDDFYRMILEAAFGFFGSLILNPRRKCDLPEDHLRRLKQLNSLSKKAATQTEILARELTLDALEAERKFLKTEFHRIVSLERYMKLPKLAPAAMTAARFVGHMLGKRLHRAILAESVTPETIRYLCLARVDGARRSFEERYKELLLAVSSELPAQSKSLTL